MSDQAPNNFYLYGTFIHPQIGHGNQSEITNQNDSRQDEQQSIQYELNDLNERVRDIETELDEQPNIRDELGNLKDRVEDLETELDSVKKKNTELENDAANSGDEIDNLRKMVKKLSSDMVNAAADSRSKIDHLTKEVKKLKETSNETKEMTVGRRKGPGWRLCDEIYKEYVDDAVSSGDEIDYERLWDMAVAVTIRLLKSSYGEFNLLKRIVALLRMKLNW